MSGEGFFFGILVDEELVHYIVELSLVSRHHS